jgi:phytoene dehydrogenase-like protein
VGSGPNGLAAALTLARAGLAVRVYEAADTPGGGCRTSELTLPGYRHDVCSAVHPLLAASPFFREATLPGIELLRSRVACAHPLDGGGAVVLSESLEETAELLGPDARAYRRLLSPLVARAPAIVSAVLAPLVPAQRVAIGAGPASFALRAPWPASWLARTFRGEPARALLAGLAAHSLRPLAAPGTSAYALLLGLLAHAVGWPLVAGGSGRIADALAGALHAAGGELQTGSPVASLDELPSAAASVLDVSPRSLLGLAGPRLPVRTRRALTRFRYGPGVCKVDWALSGPVPWSAPACRDAATLHLGGSFAEIARSEAEVAAGRHAARPFCIAVQPCVLDPTRAPRGRHILYAYCHVPSGSDVDVADRIEAQVERFAPGFRELVLARASMTAAQLERYDPNYVGGDINCGAATLRQSVLRPAPSLHPYRAGLPGVYLCSSATPPGGGVHGMCGLWAARAALADLAHSGDQGFGVGRHGSRRQSA